MYLFCHHSLEMSEPGINGPSATCSPPLRQWSSIERRGAAATWLLLVRYSKFRKPPMRENGLIRRSTLWRTDWLEGHGHRNYCPSVRFPIYVLSITPCRVFARRRRRSNREKKGGARYACKKASISNQKQKREDWKESGSQTISLNSISNKKRGSIGTSLHLIFFYTKI